ncbi:MAG: hypothetical protein NTZ60_03090 [Campylobacterales bacterium]|nr:hypothetical protein [Campylobacterales bacterium]
MEFNGDVLTLDTDMSMDEIREFEEFIRPRMDYIEVIEVEETSSLKCSAFISILASLKRTKPELQIHFLEKGMTISPVYGKIHWICHD